MRRSIKRFIGLAALAILPACSDSSGPNQVQAVTGSYALISINGILVPVVFSVDQFFILQITAGTLTMNSNNTFSAAATYQQTPAGGGTATSETITCTGTYAKSGTTVTFTEANSANDACGGVYTATWDGTNTLTVEFDVGVQALFRK